MNSTEKVPQWGHMESVDPADAVTTIASVASCIDSTSKLAGIRSEVKLGSHGADSTSEITPVESEHHRE